MNYRKWIPIIDVNPHHISPMLINFSKGGCQLVLDITIQGASWYINESESASGMIYFENKYDRKEFLPHGE